MLAERYTGTVDDLGAVLGLQEASVSHGRYYFAAKRIFDIAIASVALVALSPVFLIVAMLIRLTSPGNVIFAQQRCGQDGRLFLCYKFRSMVSNANWVLENDDSLKANFTREWKLVNDPRVTPIGKIIRKTSIDELPQLWNVLKGDMSIVGPRPVQPTELRERYGHHAQMVSRAKPGMTGLWQVSGRSSLSYEQRVALDVQYIYRRSMWFDLLIVLRTIPALIIARGAH